MPFVSNLWWEDIKVLAALLEDPFVPEKPLRWAISVHEYQVKIIPGEVVDTEIFGVIRKLTVYTQSTFITLHI